jgi:hypothetical protein
VVIFLHVREEYLAGNRAELHEMAMQHLKAEAEEVAEVHEIYVQHLAAAHKP